ncbi:MAG TPA: DUF1622 domain-containing protein [Thermomicrobiales bacterium]|jgi:uncharacterized membrane protein|nr:DUF1622 domain-containing protein [Thermomicrobiales bacterium]
MEMLTELGFEELAESVGRAMEIAGVAAIVIGAIIATISYGVTNLRGDRTHTSYRSYRRALGRSILLGLEFLVAGDIIRTVAIEPDFRSVGVLAVIVLIRTFLSAELEMEIDGRWPWQREPRDKPTASDGP